MKNVQVYPRMNANSKRVICSGLLLLSMSVHAAFVPEGSQLVPTNPSNRFPTQNSDTNLNVEHRAPTAHASSASVKINQIKVANSTVFDASALHALISDGEGKSLNLDQLNELAARITHFYQQNGYPVSRAYIPAQSIKDGILYINVLEARYGAVKVNNTSRLSPYPINSILSNLGNNQLIESSVLNRNLLLLNDLPGAIVRNSLAPGQAVGTSDLLVNIEPGPLLNGSVGIDNYGNRYTGRTRYNAALAVNNPTGMGDQIVVDGLTSGHDLIDGHIGYRIPVMAGTTTGVDLTRMTYKLSGDLSALDASGDQTIASLWMSHVWIRDINTNVNSTLRYNYKRLNDQIDAAASAGKKYRITNSGVFENTGEIRDSWGHSNVYFAVTYGNLRFNNGEDGGDFDASGPQTANNFAKANLHLSRLQQFTPSTSLYIGVDGQMASKNLDSSEQLTLGGPFSTRSYDVGTLSGAQGYFGSIELRHTLSDLPIPGFWTPMMFVDTGHVQVYKDNPISSNANTATMSSAGVGLDVDWSGWNLSTRYAHRLGSKPDTTLVRAVDENKVWVQFSKGF